MADETPLGPPSPEPLSEEKKKEISEKYHMDLIDKFPETFSPVNSVLSAESVLENERKAKKAEAMRKLRARRKLLDEMGVPKEYSIFAIARLKNADGTPNIAEQERRMAEFNERFIPKTDREIERKLEDIEKARFPDAIIPRLYRDNKTYIPMQGMRQRIDGRKIQPKIQLFDILDKEGKILKTFRTLDAAAAYMDKTTDTYLSYRGPEKQLPDKKLMRSFSIKTLYDVYDSNGKIVKSFKSRVQAHNMAFKLGTKYEVRIVK